MKYRWTDGSQIRKRSRRTPKQPHTERNGHRRSIFDPVSSGTQLSIDMDRGVVITREQASTGVWQILGSGKEKENGRRNYTPKFLGLERVKNFLGIPSEVEDGGNEDTEGGCWW